MKTTEIARKILAQWLLILLIFPSSLNAQQNSENGFSISVSNSAVPMKVMLVFAEFVGGNCNSTGNSDWPGGGLPTNVSTGYFDAVNTGTPVSYLTKYYYDASWGNFILLGDYINQVIQVPCSLNTSSIIPGNNNVINQLSTILSNAGPNTFGNPNTALSDFDKYSLPNPYAGIVKPTTPNNKIDVLIICWRNSVAWGCGTGNGLGPGGYSAVGPFTAGTDNFCSFGMCGALLQRKFMLQEIFHAMFGGNLWHSVIDEAGLTVIPNPITTSYTITTYVPEDILNAQFVVYDLVGSKLSTINVPTGINKLEINNAGLKNGIYFFTLQGNGATMSRVKVAVLK